MNQSQKSYLVKSFLWWTWFWQTARSKTLHWADAIDREEKTLKTHDRKVSLKDMKIGEHF